MRVAGAIACLSLLLPNVGSPGKTFDSRRLVPASYWDSSELKAYRQRAFEFVRKDQLPEAVKVYKAAYHEALRLGDKRSAATFLNNAGAAQMGWLRMRGTMATLLETRKLAEEIGYTEMVRLSTLNLSHLYLQMDDLPAAVEAANRGLEAMQVSDSPVYRVQVLMQLAKVRARQGQMKECERLMLQAAEIAERSNETRYLGRIWNHLGYEYLEHWQLEEAERALVLAHRILSEAKDQETNLSYPNLAKLYRIKGDLSESSHWMELSIQASERGEKRLPRWYIYQQRGLLRQAEGKPEQALEDFRQALREARLWRLDVVPASSLRISSEVKLQSIYDGFLSAGYEVYRQSPSEALKRELFLAAQENRAWSLRETVRSTAQQELPDDYYTLLADLRAAASSHDEAKIAGLRNRLMEMEAATGLLRPSVDDGYLALKEIQENLRADEAMLSFHLTSDQPMLWTLTRTTLSMHRLPSRILWAGAVSRLQKQVRSETAEMKCTAEAVYWMLLGQVPPEVAAKRHWLLALDVGLFDLPFAALRNEDKYLIEAHSLTVSPHPALRTRKQGGGKADSFLGVGDPVYNRADPRWPGRRNMFDGMWAHNEIPELPRLPGTGREIDRCGRVVASNPVLLKGNNTSMERFQAELNRMPNIIHLAAHVVQSDNDPNQSSIAMNLKQDGTPTLLSSDTITRLRTDARVVTMSGCGSGRGAALPGTGLMGLTRAWLEAGAQSVAASLWPVPDDSGDLLISFYKFLGSQNSSASDALQAAQLENLHSGTWRSHPRYWAAYFIAGKD